MLTLNTQVASYTLACRNMQTMTYAEHSRMNATLHVLSQNLQHQTIRNIKIDNPFDTYSACKTDLCMFAS